MNELATVFEITSGSNGIRASALFDFVVGAGVLILGTGFLFRLRAEKFSKKFLVPLFMIGWALFWLVMGLPIWRLATVEMHHLLQVYGNGQSEVTEGVVHVARRQPAWGHSGGDKITVGDKQFEVNFFLVTPGYRQTIAHGGVLSEGVFARLHHFHGVILKVEVKRAKP